MNNKINMSGVDDYINQRPNPLGNMLWVVLAIALLLLLGGQVKYFFVEKYAQHENFRIYFEGFCKIAACDLPPRQAPSKFTLVNTKIDLHPLEPGAIRVTLKLVNEAKFAQPYPDLRLTLTDPTSRIVGRRVFLPMNYLPDDKPNMLGAGELGMVRFDLARPHEKAVGFEVEVVQ